MRSDRNQALAEGADQTVEVNRKRLTSSGGKRNVAHVTINGCNMPTMKGKRVLTSLYLDPPAHQSLKQLSESTRVPVAVYLREAVSDLLKKYGVQAPRRKT